MIEERPRSKRLMKKRLSPSSAFWEVIMVWSWWSFRDFNVNSHCCTVEDRNLIGILETVPMEWNDFEVPSARSQINFYFLPLHEVWFRPSSQLCDWPQKGFVSTLGKGASIAGDAMYSWKGPWFFVDEPSSSKITNLFWEGSAATFRWKQGILQGWNIFERHPLCCSFRNTDITCLLLMLTSDY